MKKRFSHYSLSMICFICFTSICHLPAIAREKYLLLVLAGWLWQAGLPSCLLYAQQNKIDSLLTILKKNKEDTGKISCLNLLSREYISIGSYDSAMYYADGAITLISKLSSPQEKGMEVRRAHAAALGSIGVIYWRQGDYPKSLDYNLKALKIDEELKNKSGIANKLGNIGNVYLYQTDYPKALDYYHKALKIDESIGNKRGIGRHLMNIGNAYYEKKDYPKALDYDFRGLQLQEELGDKNNFARALGNIGNVYESQAEYAEALDYYFRSLKMTEEIRDKQGTAIHLSDIGSVYTSLKKYKDGCDYLYRALALNDSIGRKDEVKNNYEKLSKLYEQATIPLPDTLGGKLLTMEQMRLRAMYYYKRHIAIRDTIFSEKNQKQLMRKEMQFEYEKKEAASKAEQEKKEAVRKAESRKQKMVLILTSGFLVLVLIFAGFIFRSLRITREQKRIIEQQKKIVDRKNKHISDSIDYAKHIQNSILPSHEELSKYFPDYFIFFQPKDVVSGDFYWFEAPPPPEGGNTDAPALNPLSGGRGAGCFLLAVVDCTGHGVPGAFMSMMGNMLLNKIVNEQHINQPSEILNRLNEEIIHTLNRYSGSQGDGMDISICLFDKDNNKITFAGANHSIYIVSDNSIQKINGDIYSIGSTFGKKKISFSQKEIVLQKDTALYFTTDGFSDQIGEISKKRFLGKQFEKLLVDVSSLTIREQEQTVKKTFSNWKGNMEQIDDVLVVGIKI